MTLTSRDERPDVTLLFANLRKQNATLKALLDQCQQHWSYEDRVYRFYHGSFKVFALQESTLAIVDALQALLPARELNATFRRIVDAGTGKSFSEGQGLDWVDYTRPILEAFFHAKFFLEMAVKYAHELDFPPNQLPSGWAALLYLFNLR